MTTKLFRLFTVLFTLVLLAGCSKDADEPAPVTVTGGDDMTVTFKTIVPGASAPTSRAISDADETLITEIDVLVFKFNGGVETFLYRTHATDINNNGGTASKEFKAVLRKSVSTDRHRIVVLANLRSAVDNAGGFSELMTKQEVLERIRFNSSSNWNTTSSANFTPLPMWGETAGTHIITETTNASTLGEIKLLRAVARIDVGVNMNAAGIPQGLGDRFKISDIVVFNSQKQGYAAPDPANMETTIKAQYPTVPAGQMNTTQLRYSYSPATIGTAREIYLAESENATQTAADQVTCLVVGGYYTAPGSGTPNTTVKTWYRVDFYNRSSSTPANTRLDILRNHRYRVNITRVDGPGYPTESQAYESAPVNIESEVIAIDEAGMTHVTSDGTYQLTVDKDSLHFYTTGRARTMRIYTDVPAGWEIKAEDKPAWITITRDPMTTDVTVTAEAWTTPNLPRKAYFTITAGRMSKRITVYQTIDNELTLEVYPEHLTFYRSARSPKSFTVTTYPANIARNFRLLGTIPTWVAGYNPNTFNGTTNTEYSVRPSAHTSTISRSTIMTIYVQQGGEMVAKTLNITHLPYNLAFTYTAANPYPVQGGTFTIPTQSDVEWHALTAVNPGGAISQWPQTLFPAGDNNFTFTLEPNETYSASRNVAFYVTSPNPDFVQTTMVVTQRGVLPYMKWDGAPSSSETPGMSVYYPNYTDISTSEHEYSQNWINNANFTASLEEGNMADFNRVVQYMHLDGEPIVFDQTYQGGTIFEEKQHLLEYKTVAYQFYEGYPAAKSIIARFVLRFQTLSSPRTYNATTQFQILAEPFFGAGLNRQNIIPTLYLDQARLDASNSHISKDAHTLQWEVYTNCSVTLRVSISGGESVETGINVRVLSSKLQTLQIPENTTGVDRTMTIQYRNYSDEDQWVDLQVLTQSGT